MALIKTMTVDEFYTIEGATNLHNVVRGLPFQPTEFGKEILNFNHIPADADKLFSSVLGKEVTVDRERSGVFRFPELLIHFEGFDSLKEWLFVVAIDHSTFNIFEHKSGVQTALEGYQHGYRNLFEWDLMVNYQLKPGQAVFFRPWLFHSFDSGIVQMFRLVEK